MGHIPEKRWPAPADIERIAGEVAADSGVTTAEVLGPSHRLDICRARRRAILRVLSETRCSNLGLATVWGLDRKTVQRAVRAGA